MAALASPLSSPQMRAEAPPFCMPPPGLGALCGVEAALESLHGSPCSTAMPSPMMSPSFLPSSPDFSTWGAGSPGLVPSMPFGISSEGFDSWCLPEPIPEFALDGFDMDCFEFEGAAPVGLESMQTKGTNFKLDGVDDFVDLMQAFISTPTTDGGSSTALSSDEESSQPSTPDTPPGLDAFAPLGLAPPPGLELEADGHFEAVRAGAAPEAESVIAAEVAPEQNVLDSAGKSEKALRKKLRQIEELAEKQQSGEVLNEAQLAKLASRNELEAQLEAASALVLAVSTTAAPVAEAVSTASKSKKAIEKKLRQIAEIEEKKRNGEVLNDDQRQKLAAKKDLQKELALAEEVTPAPKEAIPEVEADVAPVPKEASLVEAVQKKGWTTDADDATEVNKESAPEETRKTSVMVQNVPKKCTRDLFAKVLDEAGFSGNYDLIYVVADLKQRNSGSGSALVNFSSEKACARFTKAFHKSAVAIAFPGFVGKKAIEVGPAPVQGFDANVRKLEKSSVLMSMLAERPGWQPAHYNSAGHIEAEIGAS